MKGLEIVNRVLKCSLTIFSIGLMSLWSPAKGDTSSPFNSWVSPQKELEMLQESCSTLDENKYSLLLDRFTMCLVDYSTRNRVQHPFLEGQVEDTLLTHNADMLYKETDESSINDICETTDDLRKCYGEIEEEINRCEEGRGTLSVTSYFVRLDSICQLNKALDDAILAVSACSRITGCNILFPLVSFIIIRISIF